MKCEACQDRGYILADNDVHGLRIERCDACDRFKTDAAAVKYVHKLAGAAQFVATALEGLVHFNDQDPDLLLGDEDGTLGRLMRQGYSALAYLRSCAPRVRKSKRLPSSRRPPRSGATSGSLGKKGVNLDD